MELICNSTSDSDIFLLPKVPMAHSVLKRYWARIPAVSDVCHRGCAYRIHLPYDKAWLIEVADQGLRSREAKPCCREDYGIELLTIQMPGVCSAAYRTLGINDHLKCFERSRTYTRLRASFCATLPQRAEGVIHSLYSWVLGLVFPWENSSILSDLWVAFRRLCQ